MKIILTFLLLLAGVICHAQANRFTFSYDAADIFNKK
jgi:hypothetical protein